MADNNDAPKNYDGIEIVMAFFTAHDDGTLITQHEANECGLTPSGEMIERATTLDGPLLEIIPTENPIAYPAYSYGH